MTGMHVAFLEVKVASARIVHVLHLLRRDRNDLVRMMRQWHRRSVVQTVGHTPRMPLAGAGIAGLAVLRFVRNF